jgi:hypothetical protein
LKKSQICSGTHIFKKSQQLTFGQFAVSLYTLHASDARDCLSYAVRRTPRGPFLWQAVAFARYGVIFSPVKFFLKAKT